MSKPSGVMSYNDKSDLPKKTDGTAVSRSAPAEGAGKTSPRDNGRANPRTETRTLMGSRTPARGKVKDSLPDGVSKFADHTT